MTTEPTEKKKLDAMLNEPNQNPAEKAAGLVRQLKEYDTDKHYKQTFATVSTNLGPLIKTLAQCGEASLPYLHPLLEHEETWSCWAALQTLREIKNPKSIQPLIEFILNNEYGDRWERCEDAMLALHDIGKPAIAPLLSEINRQFEKKDYRSFLTGALTGIEDDEVYSFMTQVLNDYISYPDKYDDWLDIDNFTYDFDAQKRKDVLPLLKRLAAMDHLSTEKKLEIRDTIKQIEDPEAFQREIDQFVEKAGFDTENKKGHNVDSLDLLKQAIQHENQLDYDNAMRCVNKMLRDNPKSYHALILKSRISRKIGRPNMIVWNEAMKQARKQNAGRDVLELIEEEMPAMENAFMNSANVPDESLELHFECQQCGKKQNICPGIIRIINYKKGQYIYENEIMCKHCRSHNLRLTQDGKRGIVRHEMRALAGDATGIIDNGNKIGIGAAGRRMEFDKAHPYLLGEIKEQHLNGELHLRAGNIARKMNLHEEAIKHYRRA